MKSKTLGRAKKENLMYNASFFMHDALSQSENVHLLAYFSKCLASVLFGLAGFAIKKCFASQRN